MAKDYDVAILGGTPAALAAACHLAKAKRKCNVVVVSPPPKGVECPLSDWVPRGFFELMSFLPKTFVKTSKAQAFHQVVYHNCDLSSRAEQKYRKEAGHFIPAGQLEAALRSLATRSGVKIRSTTTEPAIQLEEDRVHLVGSCQVSAKILIIAQDRPSEILGELALPVRTVPRSSLVVAGLDVPLGAATPAGAMADELHVVEMPERSELGMFFRVDSALHLRMISSSAASGNRASELSAMVSSLQQAGALPADLQLGKARGAVWHPPAGVALEMETHVAKRCLLAGTAGGFAESITGHTGYPTVRSSLLAAEITMAALDAKDPQGELMKFKTQWRRILADYLRPPNTSLHMLLPLLFANKRMASRFSSALLFGDNI